MTEKIHDRLLLILALIVASPFIIAALLAVGIGYPLHRIKALISSRL